MKKSVTILSIIFLSAGSIFGFSSFESTSFDDLKERYPQDYQEFKDSGFTDDKETLVALLKLNEECHAPAVESSQLTHEQPVGYSYNVKNVSESLLLVTIADKSGTVIGDATCMSAGEKKVLLLTIRIDRDKRGKGLGRSLFYHTMDVLKEKGYEVVDIDAEPSVDYTYEEWESFSDAERLTIVRRLFSFYRELGAVNDGGGEFEYRIPLAA